MKLLTFIVFCGTVFLAGGCSNSILFTTSSMVGIELNALEGNSQSIKLGYQRVEGVLMPVNKDGSDNGDIRDNAYSVLSVMDMDTGTLLLGNLQTTTIRQVFATGNAAANAYGTVAKSFAALQGEATLIEGDHSFAYATLSRIYSAMDNRSETDQKAKQLVQKLNAFGRSVLPQCSPFTYYYWDEANVQLRVQSNSKMPAKGDSDFKNLMSYTEPLAESKSHLSKWSSKYLVDQGFQFKVFKPNQDEKSVDAAERANIQAESVYQRQLHDQFSSIIMNNVDVKAALNYYTKLLGTGT